MEHKKKLRIAVVGTGLMGSSFALTLRAKGVVSHVVGVDKSCEHLETALSMGIINEAVTLEQLHGREDIDLVCLTIPVDKIPETAIKLLNKAHPNLIVMDMGSTKSHICELLSQHVRRSQFVATHPMWGTELHGPGAAVDNAFEGRAAVLCEPDLSDPTAVKTVEYIYGVMGMKLEYMDAEQHDIHTAYVSHISHITSYALALTVMEKEREEDHIFSLSGGGFESTVRLAKSPASMWTPIFINNKYNVLDVLREHIHQLQIIRKMIENDDIEGLNRSITKANRVAKILRQKTVKKAKKTN